jgi:FkbM family methyltransferase
MITNFDGEDYINFDGDEYFLSSTPLLDFFHTKTGNFELFTKNYHPKAGDVVFDIGAGEGEEIARFSKIVGDLGLVVAIEAHPVAFRRLVKLCKVSNLTNVICLNYAISDSNSSRAFFNLEDTYSVASNIFSGDGQNGYGVPTRRLDSILRQYSISEIDFLKMNIEGAEVPAIIGLGNYILSIKNVCISCHDFLETSEARTFQKVLDLLSGRFEIGRNDYSELYPWQHFYVYGRRCIIVDDI